MTQIAPYGSALNPVASVEELCRCGGRLIADLAPATAEKTQLAKASMTAEQFALWSNLCEVSCVGCGWIGSAIRPEEAKAA